MVQFWFSSKMLQAVPVRQSTTIFSSTPWHHIVAEQTLRCSCWRPTDYFVCHHVRGELAKSCMYATTGSGIPPPCLHKHGTAHCKSWKIMSTLKKTSEKKSPVMTSFNDSISWGCLLHGVDSWLAVIESELSNVCQISSEFRRSVSHNYVYVWRDQSEEPD